MLFIKTNQERWQVFWWLSSLSDGHSVVSSLSTVYVALWFYGTGSGMSELTKRQSFFCLLFPTLNKNVKLLGIF